MNTDSLKKLTTRQQEIFAYIAQCIEENSAPPTRVEIADQFGFRSPNAAEDHLKALAKKGHIQLQSGTSRGISISETARLVWQDSLNEASPTQSNEHTLAIIGDVAAGAPIFATQHIQSYLSVDQNLFSRNADFLLTVKGDSMINAGIFDHDLLAIKKAEIARNNDIVVARIEDDVTVKRYQRSGNTIELIAENDYYPPISVDLSQQNFTIEGVVVGLIRRWF